MIRAVGPLTPYTVRRLLRQSPTQHWSASGGAVYPLVRRLERQKLIAAERVRGDGRGGKRYSLTSAGERAVRAWLAPPFDPAVVGVPPDPLRTRLALLASADAATRSAFVTAAVAAVQAQLTTLTAFVETLPPQVSRPERLAGRGAVRAMQARLDWLLEVRREFDSDADPTG
jgi:DNA-binding PadR family transcriptional regulator